MNTKHLIAIELQQLVDDEMAGLTEQQRRDLPLADALELVAHRINNADVTSRAEHKFDVILRRNNQGKWSAFVEWWE